MSQERQSAQNSVRTGADGTTPEGVMGAFVFIDATVRADINIPVPELPGHTPLAESYLMLHQVTRWGLDEK